ETLKAIVSAVIDNRLW
ncbi:hypothetical protein QN277_013785, partial [Acacia crassicarpa]